MIWQYFVKFAYSTWELLTEMAPYLLLGFFIAGVLYILIPQEKIYRHFSKDNIFSIIKVSLFGVPLPLCSCGVIPVAASLKKQGAGKSSTLTFLISTPTTGVDSILATYSLLGPLFAIIRPIAAFFSGILGGGLLTLFGKRENKELVNKKFDNYDCKVCDITTEHTHSIFEKIREMFKYGFIELVEDIGKWLIIGILAGGLISALISPGTIQKYLGNSFVAYTAMILISVPLYVCATGSIPIAASLILGGHGITPGAALVFLIAGPATNTATISFVGGKLGRRTLIIYLITIIISALLFGFLVDYLWIASGKDVRLISSSVKMLPSWIKELSSVVLIFLVLNTFFFKKTDKLKNEGILFKVEDMTCQHCVKTIKESLLTNTSVKNVNINLKNKIVEVIGDNIAKKDIMDLIKKAGYTPTFITNKF